MKMHTVPKPWTSKIEDENEGRKIRKVKKQNKAE